MILVTEFEIQSGRLILIRGFPDQATLDLNRREGFDFIEGENDQALFYVKEGIITERPSMAVLADKAMIKADGEDLITISGLPAGDTSVSLYGPVTDSWSEKKRKVELTTNMPGTYRLFISQWPYQNIEVTFDAT